MTTNVRLDQAILETGQKKMTMWFILAVELDAGWADGNLVVVELEPVA